MREHEKWSVHLPDQGWGEKPGLEMSKFTGDGIIARIETPTIAAALAGTKVPLVDVSSSRLMPEVPWVENDYGAIAQLAFDHFRSRGFKRFGFCGDSRYTWAKWLGDHFAQTVRKGGFRCDVCIPGKPTGFGREEEINELKDWLSKLEKPVAVMGCNDFRGRQIVEAAKSLEIAVPDEIAVLGEDNDQIFCELSDPPLSSVAQNSSRIGFEAAVCLSKLMNGEQVTNQGIFIPPIGVVTRQSTDVLAIEDKNVTKSIRFIREHACDGINVKDVLKAVPQSRRMLESRFQKLVGRTPHEEILHVQLTKIKELLIETDLTMEVIAEKCGFAYVEYMSVAFKRIIGVPPSEYRRFHQLKRS